MDGAPQHTYASPCEEALCAIEGTWIFDPKAFPGPSHIITVSGKTKGGATTTYLFRAHTASEAIRRCSESEFGKPVSSETESLPSGGTRYTYVAGEGATSTQTFPPESFDPLTASAEELELYEWPPRPSEPAPLQEWESMAAQYSYHPPIPPDPCAASTSTRIEAAPAKGHEEEIPNWSGYEAEDYVNADIIEVHGRFRQPASHPDAEDCDGNSAASTWVGIGGGLLSYGLIQAGTEIDKNNHIRGFYQWKNRDGDGIYAHTIPRKQFKVNSRDIIDVQVRFYPKSHTMSFFLFEHGTNDHFSESFDEIKDVEDRFYSGNGAEFIDERPEVVGEGITQLKNFKETEWFGALTVEGGGDEKYLGESPRSRISMGLYKGGKRYAEPGPLSSNGRRFTDHWRNCKVPGENERGEAAR